MAGRPGLDPIEEGKSYSALFVLMIAVLMVSAIWAIWDDNISRRPWKEYQVKFDELAYNKYMKDVAAEQKKLNDNPDYVKDEKDLTQAQHELASGQTQRKLDELEAQEVNLKNIADDKDQAVRFTKSILTERMYDYNHAIQVKEDAAPIWSEIQKLQKELDGENAESDKAKKDLQERQGPGRQDSFPGHRSDRQTQGHDQDARRPDREGQHLHDPDQVHGSGHRALS